MRRFVAGAVSLLAAGCGSSAPYTVPSAAINTALAAGAAAAQASSGGCYAVCAYGTFCNPRTGFCEREQTACAGGADPRCAPPAPGWGVEQGTSVPPPVGRIPGLGLSPATGRAPPGPGQRETDATQ